eukprot:68972_1
MDTKIKNEIDFAIFESKEIHCRECKLDTISNCSAIKRIIVALKYYDLLCGGKNKKKQQQNSTETTTKEPIKKNKSTKKKKKKPIWPPQQTTTQNDKKQKRHQKKKKISKNRVTKKIGQELLITFCTQQYSNFLNDYIHVITCHGNGNNVTQINSELINKYGFKTCNLSLCDKSVRHFEREEHKESDMSEDIKYSFYSSYFDSLHFFLFHLFDMAYRSEINDNSDGIDDTAADSESFASIDTAFATKRDKIAETKKKYATNIGRLNVEKNSKFNIKITQHRQTKTDQTFLDELYKYLIRWHLKMTSLIYDII